MWDKKQFWAKRRLIPVEARKKQAQLKKAMRAALIPEVWDFRFAATLDAALRGDKERAALYRLREEKGRFAYDVSHLVPVAVLRRNFLLQNDLCCEDVNLVGYGLRAPHLKMWRDFHRRYSEKHKNLFLQPRRRNGRESRAWVPLPSRLYGSF